MTKEIFEKLHKSRKAETGRIERHFTQDPEYRLAELEKKVKSLEDRAEKLESK